MLKKLRLNPLMAPDGDPPGSPPSGDPPQETPPAEFKPEEWRSLLPEDQRDNPIIRDLATPEDVVKSLAEAQGMIGNSIRVPSEEASADDISAFHESLMQKAPGLMLKPDLADDEAMGAIYNQLGRPAEGKDYSVPEIDDQGIELDGQMTEVFRDVAHKAGLNQKQFESVVKDITEANIKAAIEARKAHDADTLALSKEWGAVYEDRLATIKNFAQQLRAPQALLAALDNNQVDSDTLKWFHSLSEAIGAEGGALNQDPPNNRSGRMTPSEANARISEINRNKAHAYWNAEDPDHHAALELMIELRKLADPNASDNINDLRATGQ